MKAKCAEEVTFSSTDVNAAQAETQLLLLLVAAVLDASL